MAGLAFSNIGTTTTVEFPASPFLYVVTDARPSPAHELTFRREAWADVRGVIAPFWQRHYAEIARDQSRIPLDPDWDKYDELDTSGALHILVARDRDGAMVGYVFSLLGPHLHYKSTPCAFLDLYWLEPHARKGWNGVKLFRALEGSLKACGVAKVFGQTKVWQDVSPIFQRLGWTEAERSFVKWIA